MPERIPKSPERDESARKQENAVEKIRQEQKRSEAVACNRITASQGERILRRPEVEARTGLSRSSIYAKLDPKSPYHDPAFPRPVRLGLRAVGWTETSVSAWLGSRSHGAA